MLLSGCSKELPPTYGNILRMGDVVTYAAQRALLPGESLVREYSHKDITSFPAIGTTNPADPGGIRYNGEQGPAYDLLRVGGFADFRLSIEGSVARPGSYSLEDLKRFPSRTQITRHACEEGWSAIAEWTGVPLRLLLEDSGILPSARFVNYYTFDVVADGIDLVDALHPQTILAYGMNGRDLLVRHGAPVRLRVEKQVGYKSTKFVRRIVVTDEFEDFSEENLGPLRHGWSWYVGI